MWLSGDRLYGGTHLQNTQHRHTGEVWMFSVWELMQTSPSPPLTCLQLSPACFCASVIDDGYFNAEQEHACEHKATFVESFFRSSVDQRSYTPESRSSDPTQSRQRPTVCYCMKDIDPPAAPAHWSELLRCFQRENQCFWYENELFCWLFGLSEAEIWILELRTHPERLRSHKWASAVNLESVW